MQLKDISNALDTAQIHGSLLLFSIQAQIVDRWYSGVVSHAEHLLWSMPLGGVSSQT